jgi:glyoxylase-like metal-dependent hydrolase (beta-lactamase superfamily II)
MKQTFCKSLIYDNTWQILEFGYDGIYYIEGDERGLLIDTGIGGGDLKAFVDEIATKPYDVVLTHGHLDHVGAICQFEKIYINKKDWAMLEATTDEGRKWFIENLYEMSIGYVPDQDSSEMVHFTEKLPELINVGEGDIFDLGGRKVSIQAIPGHTDGCICLYDDLSQILFVGDSIIGRLLMVAGADDYTERLKTWKENADRIFMNDLSRFRGLYMGHYGYASSELLHTIYEIVQRLIDDISLVNQENGFSYKIGEYQVCMEFPAGLGGSEK